MFVLIMVTIIKDLAPFSLLKQVFITITTIINHQFIRGPPILILLILVATVIYHLFKWWFFIIILIHHFSYSF